jgi:hypothetical protein
LLLIKYFIGNNSLYILYLSRDICYTLKISNGRLPGIPPSPIATIVLGNGGMNKSFFVPSEGFGFSNYYHTGLRKPSYI